MKSIQTILLTDLFRVSLSSTSGHGKISVCGEIRGSGERWVTSSHMRVVMYDCIWFTSVHLLAF